MMERVIETSATPHVTVEQCLGDLTVRGSADRRLVLRVHGDEGDATLDQEGEVFTLAARVTCELACPSGATLTIDEVGGNLRVEGVAGTLAVDTVRGNASLRDVGPAAVERVLGNLRARQVSGDLQVVDIKGNARLGDIDGEASLERVAGNLTAEGLAGGLAASQVHGNARLDPPFPAGASYRVAAHGNVRVRLPEDASVELDLRCAGQVRSRIDELALAETDEGMTGTLGDGEAHVQAHARGNVTLVRARPAGESLEEMATRFAAGLEGLGEILEGRISEVVTDLESHVEEGLARIDDLEIRRQVERATEQALRTAETAVDKARREAQREAERARMQAERAERRWQRASGRRSRSRAASNEERLKILQLVEEGKITPDEAADLLAALDRR